MAGGTLEGTGPNAKGTTRGYCRDLGFTSITDNASVSPSTNVPKGSNAAASAAPLVNMVDTSSDTEVMEVPGGTLEGGGPNG